MFAQWRRKRKGVSKNEVETLPQRLLENARIMTDDEAQRFFEGLPQDEDGAYIMGNPDEDPTR